VSATQTHRRGDPELREARSRLLATRTPIRGTTEGLRLWVGGHGLRALERLSGLDRKTVRRYVDAAKAAGVTPEGGEGQLDAGLIGSVVEAVRPHRTDGHGQAWRLLAANHDRIKAWLDECLTVVKCHDLLTRRGVVVPERTLHRYALVVCGRRRGRGPTVRVDDGEPGDECQVDFGRMGTLGRGVRKLPDIWTEHPEIVRSAS
jgi:hypothetical protein